MKNIVISFIIRIIGRISIRSLTPKVTPDYLYTKHCETYKSI